MTYPKLDGNTVRISIFCRLWLFFRLQVIRTRRWAVARLRFTGLWRRRNSNKQNWISRDLAHAEITFKGQYHVSLIFQLIKWSLSLVHTGLLLVMEFCFYIGSFTQVKNRITSSTTAGGFSCLPPLLKWILIMELSCWVSLLPPIKERQTSLSIRNMHVVF